MRTILFDRRKENTLKVFPTCENNLFTSIKLETDSMDLGMTGWKRALKNTSLIKQKVTIMLYKKIKKLGIILLSVNSQNIDQKYIRPPSFLGLVVKQWF